MKKGRLTQSPFSYKDRIIERNIMIETVTRTRFINWFRQSNTYKNQFSFEAQFALYDYFEELELDTSESPLNFATAINNAQLQFDPIAICCDYTEYENIEEYNKNYEPVENLDQIRELTTVIEIPQNKGFIIQNY
jgi:hypothetical protein